jgi:pyridoxamine 5'-phosphate oxidase
MTLATSTTAGAPSARIVLLKEVVTGGFIFYSNYTSRKGTELEANPVAALLFHWGTLERQVRIEGRVQKIPVADSEAYFQSRPRGSQVSAVISHQSQVVGSRSELELRSRSVSELYRGQVIPRPINWGGYILAPHAIEFWQGRENRLHDRLLYTLQESGSWIVRRLAP